MRTLIGVTPLLGASLVFLPTLPLVSLSLSPLHSTSKHSFVHKETEPV